MNSGDRDGVSDVIPADVTEDKPVIERRRPGRVHYTSQALIGLLRRRGSSHLSEAESGSPARGIIIGLGISALLWSAIGLIVWIVLKRW